MKEKTVHAGSLVLGKFGDTGVVQGYRDSSFKYFDGVTFSCALPGGSPFTGEAEYFTFHPWNELFQVFMKMAAQAGRDPGKFQAAHDEIKRVIDEAVVLR